MLFFFCVSGKGYMNLFQYLSLKAISEKGVGFCERFQFLDFGLYVFRVVFLKNIIYR